ncbi:uncharacterized protein BO80DRAFT_222919 [Aspergillus ibericus CBS 121593]|uniref:Uncharacterized protein n=1 Tax=Aspergillus ibericus CBS 121593 TaxID=1448316 RepID=A0A395GR46_9EURO|nr:hypothetical protein BO80DRAFT_222919 [Aspergillus ibericus CBS 121593]RAK96543.1 hypothetical protein BO80DRAFT_222919 [Aspergillus ibericus CBS 121593]
MAVAIHPPAHSFVFLPRKSGLNKDQALRFQGSLCRRQLSSTATQPWLCREVIPHARRRIQPGRKAVKKVARCDTDRRASISNDNFLQPSWEGCPWLGSLSRERAGLDDGARHGVPLPEYSVPRTSPNHLLDSFSSRGTRGSLNGRFGGCLAQRGGKQCRGAAVALQPQVTGCSRMILMAEPKVYSCPFLTIGASHPRTESIDRKRPGCPGGPPTQSFCSSAPQPLVSRLGWRGLDPRIPPSDPMVGLACLAISD